MAIWSVMPLLRLSVCPVLYSIIMRNTSITHIINYSSLKVIRPKCYCRHGSYTSDCAFYIKNPWAKRLFIPLLVQMNRGICLFFGRERPKYPKVDIVKHFKIVPFLVLSLIKNLCYSIGATHQKWPSKSHIVAIVSIYSIIMRNTSITYIINYSSLQVIRPRYYCRHGSYTSD